LSFEYIKYFLNESQEIVIKLGCVICVSIFVYHAVRNKISEFKSENKDKK